MHLFYVPTYILKNPDVDIRKLSCICISSLFISLGPKNKNKKLHDPLRHENALTANVKCSILHTKSENLSISGIANIFLLVLIAVGVSIFPRISSHV